MKRPALYIVVPFSLGVILSAWLNLPFLVSAAASLIFLCGSVLFSKNRLLSHTLLYAAIFLIGIASYAKSSALNADQISNYISDGPRKALLKGVITDDPITTDTPFGLKKTAFTLSSYYINENDSWDRVEGLVRVRLYSAKQPSYSFGDGLMLEGALSGPSSLRNPGVFDYSNYFKIKGIYATLNVSKSSYTEKIDLSPPNPIKALAYKARHILQRFLNNYFEGSARAFLNAVLLGDRTDIGDDLRDDFVKTGTVHILAISGLHVGIIAAILLLMLGAARVPKKINLILTMLFLIFYAFVTGANPPIVRSVIMFSVFALGYAINRETDLLNSLCLAAVLILAWNPKTLFGPSFQLSFASVASIIILYPALSRHFGIEVFSKSGFLRKAKSYAIKGVFVSVAAWLGTWPLIALYFNTFSPISIIANLAVIPLLFVAILFSFPFFLSAAFLPSTAFLFSDILTNLTNLLFSVNHFLSGLKFSYFRIGAPSAGFLFLYYILLSASILPASIRIREVKLYKNDIIAAVLLICNIAVWSDNLHQPSKALKITFLDVGQGDSAHIEFPGEGNLIIDGGSGGEEAGLDIGRNVIAPYLWNKGIMTIDAVIITHFHEDHLGGLIYVLDNFIVRRVMDNGSAAHDNGLFRKYLRTIKEKNIPRFVLREGDLVKAGPVNLFVLNPEEARAPMNINNDSLALKLVYKNFTCLFCGDIEDEAIERISSYGNFLKSDAVKIPHHGGRIENTLAAKKFYDEIYPRVSVISSAKIERNNLQSQNLINDITDGSTTNYITRYNGAVEITVDPEGDLREVKNYQKN